MWYSVDHRDGVEQCGSHSLHQTVYFSGSMEVERLEVNGMPG